MVCFNSLPKTALTTCTNLRSLYFVYCDQTNWSSIIDSSAYLETGPGSQIKVESCFCNKSYKTIGVRSVSSFLLLLRFTTTKSLAKGPKTLHAPDATLSLCSRKHKINHKKDLFTTFIIIFSRFNMKLLLIFFFCCTHRCFSEPRSTQWKHIWCRFIIVVYLFSPMLFLLSHFFIQ